MCLASRLDLQFGNSIFNFSPPPPSFLPSQFTPFGLPPCRSRHVSQWARESRYRRGLPKCIGRRWRMVSPLLSKISGVLLPLLGHARRTRVFNIKKQTILTRLDVFSSGSCCTIFPEMRSTSLVGVLAGCPRYAMPSITLRKRHRYMAFCIIDGGK